MKRPNPYFVSLIASAVTSFLLLTATTASAAAPAGYSAKPAAVADTAKFVARDTIWRCGPDGCVSASKANSRAAFVCEALVKEVGAVTSFRAAGETFDAEALAKCNARAKGGQALAKAD